MAHGAHGIPAASRHDRAGEREGFSAGLEGVSSLRSLTLKKNKKLCVAPEAPWIQLLIHRLTQRYAAPGTPAPSGGGAGRQGSPLLPTL